MNMNNKKPLVSICVITYNSSDTVLETLESAKSQTYQNIELIVSDDGSKDDTVAVCEKWLIENKDRFIHSEIVTVPRNTGTSANYNRAVDHSNGEWIKTIDGDDILLENCIQDNIYYVAANPEAKVVFSDYFIFKNKQRIREFKDNPFMQNNKNFFTVDTHNQYISLLSRNILPSPASFLYGDLIRHVRFDERYRYIEDAPLWIKLTKQGIRMYLLNKKTVMYRNQESISKSSTKYFSPLHVESSLSYFWCERYYYIKENNLQNAYDMYKKIYLLYDIADILFCNKKTKYNYPIYKTIRFLIMKFIKFKL